MKVAFRANGGGAGIGFGHLMRCIAVADEFRKKGAKVIFVSKDHEAGVRLLAELGYDVQKIPKNAALDDDLRQSLSLMKDADIIIADSYEFDSNYLANLKTNKNVVASFSDIPDRNLPVDVVIGNIQATEQDCRSRMRNDTVLLSGPAYLPLRSSFQNLPKHTISEKIRRVLVTMGGEDIVNAAQKVVEALENYPGKLTLDLLIGSAYKHKESLQKAMEKSSHKCELRENVKEIVPLYQDADVAITAPGVTLLELAATGTPSLIIQTADNQGGVVRFVAEKNLGVVLGWYNKVSSQDITTGLGALEDQKMRTELSERCQNLIDGKGAERIASALTKEYKTRCSK